MISRICLGEVLKLDLNSLFGTPYALCSSYSDIEFILIAVVFCFQCMKLRNW